MNKIIFYTMCGLLGLILASSVKSEPFPGPGGGNSPTICHYYHKAPSEPLIEAIHIYAVKMVIGTNCPDIDPPQEENGDQHTFSKVTYSSGTKKVVTDSHKCEIVIDWGNRP